MNLESLMRQALRADRHITTGAAGERHLGHLSPAHLPSNAYLRLGDETMAGPPFAHGMTTRSTVLASTFGLRGTIQTVDALAAILVRRGPGGPVIAVIGAPADPPTASERLKKNRHLASG